jgi:pimeloyl-ACP methyl ester carboxylesterase
MGFDVCICLRAALPDSLELAETIQGVLLAQGIQLDTSDGIRLTSQHWDPGLRDLGCVVAHGFTGSSRTPDVQAISRALAGTGAGVLAIDFRGHGRSGGRSTVGAEEIHDVAAAVAWLRARGYQRVAVLGWSMGGSAVLRYAGLGGDADAVVSVSSPARWYERGTRPMRVVHWLCETRTGHLVLRWGRRTRMAGAHWDPVPEAPHEVAGLIAPTPLLIIHGDADRYFPLPHVHLLRDSAPSAEVWIEPGMGHAENATTPELIERVGAWLKRACLERTPGAEVCDDGLRD